MQQQVISPNDIAVYGGLCALASFDRSELKSKVIDNAEFKQFLELEPHIRELIHGFYNSKYSVVLDILDKWKVNLSNLYEHMRVLSFLQNLKLYRLKLLE